MGELGRRQALKAAVGASAAGLVWSAPRIDGLSIRPSYAAASSSLVAWEVTIVEISAVKKIGRMVFVFCQSSSPVISTRKSTTFSEALGSR